MQREAERGSHVYAVDLNTRTARKVASAEDGFVTDPKVSPKGSFVSFVRNQNLHLVDLGTGETRALTTDGGGTISNGMAEFIAQVEAGRWSQRDPRAVKAPFPGLSDG